MAEWSDFPEVTEVTSWDDFPVSQDEVQSSSEPLFDISDTLAATGQALGGLTTTTPHAYRQLAEGMGNPWKRSPEYRASQKAMSQYAQELEAANKAAQESGDISVLSRGMRGAGQSLGFSAGAMGSSLVGGSAVGTAGRYIGSLAGPEGAAAGEFVGRGVGALGASYGAAYRMAGAQFLDDAREAIDAKFQRLHNRLPTEEEQDEAYQELLPLAEAFGQAEAGPEAIGNFALGLGGKYVLGLGKKKVVQLADSALTKALKKTAAATAAAATEFGGETVTQVEQNRIDEQARAAIAGEEPPEQSSRSVDEYLGALKEIAPTTAATMALMGGVGAVAKGAQRLMTPAQPAQPTEESEEPMVLGRTVQQVLDEADAVSARAVVQAEEAGSPLLAQAIAEQAAAPVPEAQTEKEENLRPEDIGEFEEDKGRADPADLKYLQKRWQQLEDRALKLAEFGEAAAPQLEVIREEQRRLEKRIKAIAEQTAATVPEAQAETAEPSVATEPEAAAPQTTEADSALAARIESYRKFLAANPGYTGVEQDLRDALAEQRRRANKVVLGAVPQVQPQVSFESRNKEMLPEKDDFGGKFVNPLNIDPASYSRDGDIETVNYINPETGEVDVFISAFGNNDYIAYMRQYDEQGRPTNSFTSKLERRTNKTGATKKMLQSLQARLPANHRYTEDVSVSTDGLRFFLKQLRQGYLVETENGAPVTTEVAVSGESIQNDLPVSVNPNGKFENIRINNRNDFDKVRAYLGKMLEGFGVGLGEKNVRWENGTAFIDLPVLRKKTEKSPAVNAVTTEEQETLPLLPQEEGQAGESRPAVTAEKMPDTSEVPSVAPSAEVPAIQESELSEGAQRNQDLIAQAAATNAGRAPVSANEYIQKAAAAPQSNLPPVTLQEGEAEVQAAPERAVEQNPVAAMAAQAAAKARGEVKEVSVPLARMLQPSPPSPSAPAGLGAGAATTPQGATESPTAPATAEDIADRINASSLSPATTYPSLVQDIKSLTEGKPARLQEVADALFEQPMQRPTAEKIARRLLDENAAEREVTASRDRRVARDMIGEEENQRGGEAPVSDDKAPLEKGEFVAWQGENGAMQEGVLTKISAGRNNLGEPMSEVTLETSEVVQVPRRELRPMASQRANDIRDARAAAIKSLRGHLGEEVSVGVSAVDGINAMTSLQGAVPGVQKAWIGTREDFLADESLGRAFPGIRRELESPRGDQLEGLFDGGRAFVFINNVGVYEGDVRVAKEQSELTGEEVTPQQAAVQRVITHEGLVHRGFYALDKDTRRALFQWGAQNIYEAEMDAMAEEYGYADDWRTNERSREWIMEEILAKKIERLKAPPKSGPLKALWDILASLWRKLTGSVQEVTLKDIQDVAKVLRTALELSENNVETRNGMPIRVEVARPSVRAYHGTPHKIVEGFSVDKIGTGEGAQAYGWGLYFAEDRGIGEYYQRALTDNTLYFKGRPLLKNGIMVGSLGDVELDDWFYHGSESSDPEESAQSAEAEGRPDIAAKIRSLIPDITKGEPGNLYTVELLPDEDEFLDWDKPLSEQKNPKLDALKKQHRAFLQDPAQRISDKGKNGDSLYHMVTRQKGSEKAASEYLASLGIPGIKYLDAGSRGKGDGTRNFVVFDPSSIRILEENGVPRPSLRPRFTSPLDATLSDTAKALRLMRDGPPATPVDLQQAYAVAVRGKSSAMVSLDDLFAAAKASSPSLTEAEFGRQVQNLYNDNGAYVESAESPAVMKQSADRYNVRSSQGIPASYVMILETGRPMASYRLPSDKAGKLNRAVWEAQEASGPIKDSEQTPLKDFPVHSFAQQSGESRTDAAIQVVDELLKSGVPINGLVDAINSYDLHRQLGIERDPDMLGILLAEAMRRGDPSAFKAYQVARERAGRALGTGAILHKDPRYQHLFLLEGMKDEQVQQARDIQNANAPMTADEVKRLDAEAGRTAAAEDAGAVQDALEEDLLEIGEKGLSPKESTLWEKAKYLVARIGYLLKLGSGDSKPSLRFEFPDSEKQALSKLSADERQKELEKTRAELRATLGELLGQRKPRKATGGVETIEGDLTTRAVADMVQRMQERLNIPVDTATAIDALTTTGNLKGQFENFISDSLISKVKSAMTPKQAPVKNLNSVIRQITSILAGNLNLPKMQTAKESLGERALDTFGRVRSNEQMIREAWERSREGIRQYLAERAVEGKEGLTEEEAAEIEEAVDAQLDAIASSVPARMWARGQAYSLIRDALEGSKFGTNEDILRDPQAALKTVQDRLNSEVGKIGNVDPARWDSDQAYIVAAFNSLVADLKERKAKAEARRAGKTRSGLMTGSDKKTLTSLIEQARKRSGDKAPLLPDSATWTKIFSGSPQSQEAKAKEMLEYMKADPLLSNLTAAEQQQLADMFARRWEQKRKELLEAKVASILKARNATPKGKNAAKDAVPKFIQAINRGELTNDVIAEEIAEKFGFEKLTEGEKKTLERLSRELQEPNLPQHEKTAKIDEMAKIIARKTSMSKAEILSAWWVTSVLSGPRTAFTIGLAASNGAFEVLGHAVSTVLNANWNGRRAEGLAAAGQALTNYFKSWPRAIQLAWQYVLTGDKKLLSAMDPTYSQFFETGRNNPLSVGWRLSQSKNPMARATGRFMHFFEKLLSALDLFTATTTRHGMLPISYYLNQKVYDKARVASETDLANYRKKVIDLWWGGKEPTTGAEQALVTRQSINLMEEQLAKYANVLEDAGFAAAQAAMTLTPEGLGGQFYQAVRSVANKAERSSEKMVREAERLDGKDHGPIERNTRKALAYLYRFLAYQMLNVAGLRFARFAGNKLNQSLGFIPGLGLLRKFEKDYAGPMKNQAIMRNQAIGAMMAMVGYNVLKAIGDEPDDDKRGWGIEGSWKNLTPDQIKQLQAAGRKQYTIHIGDMSFNYANWPVSSVLAAIGTMADRIKYSPDKWKETSAIDKIATGAWAASTATMDASSLSQLAEVFGSNIHTRDPVEASAKWASRVFGNYAGGMIPRVFKDADLILDGKMGKYDGWENFGKEIPVYRRYVGGPLLDIFGKQVEVSRTPWSREFQVQPPEREYRLLGQLNSNDLWLTPANPGGRRVGRGKRSREMTDAEQKRYVTLVGDGYRKVVLKFGDRLAKMDHEGAKDLLGKLTAQVRDRAERQAVTQQ